MTVATAADFPEAQKPNGGGSPIIKWRGMELIQNTDNSQFANLLDTGKFTQIFKLSEMFSSSQLVPQHFRGQMADCFIAIQMAIRLGVDPFMFMQNVYVVHGRPGMQAQIAIALINSSGLFTDPIDYEIEGSDPRAENYRVRAFATRKSTGKLVQGPWVDWKIVKAEKWDAKDGSKWKTIPGLMFMYRAGAWFGRLFCPERLMGMQTVEEIDDVPAPKLVDSTVVAQGVSGLVEQLKSAGKVLDTATGEVKENSKADPDSQLDTQTQADAAGHAEAPQSDSQTEDVILPDPCNEDQITNLLMQRKPPAMPDDDASAAITKFLRTGMDTKWTKLPRESQVSRFKRWSTDGFPAFNEFEKSQQK